MIPVHSTSQYDIFRSHQTGQLIQRDADPYALVLAVSSTMHLFEIL